MSGSYMLACLSEMDMFMQNLYLRPQFRLMPSFSKKASKYFKDWIIGVLNKMKILEYI